MPFARKAAILATALTAFAGHLPALAFDIKGTAGTKLTAKSVAEFQSPWAMTFVDNVRVLVTTKPGKMFVVNIETGDRLAVSGVPKPAVGGQGGLGDIVLHPDFADNSLVYLSLVEREGGLRGAVVVRGKLDLSGSPKLTDVERIWTQQPKMRPGGHFSQRIAFGPKGGPHQGKIFITSGDRQLQTPAQDWDKALGKIIRLNEDGSVPTDNPWQDKGELAKTYWSTGHRNPLGIAFAPDGTLWTNEMGPRHGDELNLIVKGDNYGWPVVSQGDNYSGRAIPDHDTRPEFNSPEAWWVPSIAPSSLTIYSADLFTKWKGDALIGGLVSRALIHVDIDGDKAREAERFEWGKRIREVEQGPNGALWVLEDRSGGRLLKLTPIG